MANTIVKIKRTAVSGRAANTTTLTNPGELALNMTDGIMYSTNGSVVFEVGANNTNVNITGNATIKAVIANGSIGTATQVLSSNGTGIYWASPSAGSIAGANTQIQFNDSGAAGATAGFTFDKTSNTISIGNASINTIANAASVLPGIMYHNFQNITTDYTIANNYSASMVGPITVAIGKTLTVNSGARFVVI